MTIAAQPLSQDDIQCLVHFIASLGAAATCSVTCVGGG
jgi:hypothetical protein